jgi:hypothetical protein
MRMIVLEAAEEDFEGASDYIENQRAGEGAKFEAKVEEALGRMLLLPYASSKLKRNYRVCQLKKYRRYGILYRIVQKTIVVHGIIHLQRGKGLWRKRLM